MAALTVATVGAVLDVYDFRNIEILSKSEDWSSRRHSRAESLVSRNALRFPQAIEQACLSQSLAKVRDRLTFESGSFFDGVPPDGDAYIMKTVLHDWDDESVIRILSSCRQAMKAGSKLLLVEAVLGPEGATEPVHVSLDIEMLATTGGRE